MEVANKHLPEADERPVYWNDPESNDHEALDDWKATYNPETGDIYSVVTADYQIIQPPQFIGPLVEEIKERDRDDLEGYFTVFDGGGSGYGELLFDTGAIWPPDRSRSDEPVRTGVELRWSHDGGVSVRASGFAQDGMCTNTMRQVTDSVYVKHAGDVGERVNWNSEWDGVLDQLGVFSEALATVIEEAMNFTLFDLSEDSFSSTWIEVTDPQEALEDVQAPPTVEDRAMRGLHGFFDYLGFPNYLCLSAVDRLSWRLTKADDPRDVTAWHAYSAITYALSHEARFDQGSSSDDKYHRYASDILSNPQKALDDAQQSLAQRAQPDEAAQDTLIEGTTGEALTAYQEREQMLRSAFESE